MSVYFVTNLLDGAIPPAGSLRDAITSANSDPGSTIDITVSGIISLTAGEIPITANMTIIKSVVGTVNVQRDASVIFARIFNIGSGITVSISDITISNGNIDDPAGGILINDTNSVTINNCIFDGNNSSLGGAIYSIGSTILNINDCIFENNNSEVTGAMRIEDNVSVNVINTIFRNNTASVGIGAVSVSDDVTAVFSDCLFENNSSVGDAGAIRWSGDGICSVNNSIFRNNSSGTNGGAIFSTRGSIINNCIIEGNIANNGGGIYNAFGSTPGMLIIIETSINNNTAISAGGGHYNDDGTLVSFNKCTIDNNISSLGSGVYDMGTTMNFFNSTISNNTGGDTAISISFSNKTMINTTISGNANTTSAMNIGSTTLTLINSTISNNGPLGINLLPESILNIGNTVVAVNDINTNPDFSVDETAIINSSGYNFIGNADGTNGAFTSPGDQTGTTIAPINPFLLPLGNYGGPTLTMLPSIGISPLIDTGSNIIVSTYFIYPQVLDAGQPIDQRGFNRIVNGTVDIGSVEVGPIICYSGESKVLVKDKITGKVQKMRVDNVIPGTLVYDLTNKKFIPVLRNVITGPANRMMKIPKNSLGTNQPFEDFYITSGHPILINGIPTKARDIPQAKRIQVKQLNVYSICTKDQTAICINGLPVLTWREKKFLDYAHKNHISWTENGKKNLQLNNL